MSETILSESEIMRELSERVPKMSRAEIFDHDWRLEPAIINWDFLGLEFVYTQADLLFARLLLRRPDVKELGELAKKAEIALEAETAWMSAKMAGPYRDFLGRMWKIED